MQGEGQPAEAAISAADCSQSAIYRQVCRKSHDLLSNSHEPPLSPRDLNRCSDVYWVVACPLEVFYHRK
jgi:hypothetical protein